MGSQKHIKITSGMEFLLNSGFSSRDTHYGVDHFSSLSVTTHLFNYLPQGCSKKCSSYISNYALFPKSSESCALLVALPSYRPELIKTTLSPLRLWNYKSNLFSFPKSMKPRLMILETPQITVIRSPLRMFPTKRMKIASL